MPTATAAKPVSRTRRRPADRISAWFRQWLVVSDEADQLEERAGVLKARLMKACEDQGQEDEKGSLFIDLTTPVTFKDHEGDVKRYVTLKREKYVSPATPLPDPEKAEKLLRRMKRWLKPADEKALKEIGINNPYVKITVTVDVDALAQAYFKGLISEEDYDACLVEQKTNYRFKPLTR